jgi:hypothetical protein
LFGVHLFVCWILNFSLASRLILTIACVFLPPALPIGDFVIVDPYPPAKSDAKTRGEVAHILLPDHIKSLKQAGQWYVLIQKHRLFETAIEF